MHEIFFNHQSKCVKVPQSPILKLISPFSAASCFSKNFSTPGSTISKTNIFLINILVFQDLTSRIHLLIFLETPIGSISLLNICYIFSQISQIYNFSMIGRNFQIFVHITGKSICKSQNRPSMFLFVPLSQHFSPGSYQPPRLK